MHFIQSANEKPIFYQNYLLRNNLQENDYLFLLMKLVIPHLLNGILSFQLIYFVYVLLVE